MAKVAEGMGRVASEITARRRQRGNIRSRYQGLDGASPQDIESFLQNAKSERGKATRQQAEHGRDAAEARP